MVEVSALDVVVFAPLAPLFGLVLFWFIQLLFIETQKHLLRKLGKKHEPLIRFTNFIGLLFQTMCHALGYTVTRSGISRFYLSVHYGHVDPKKEKQGVFEWVSNGFLFIGPFFIPPLLLLFCLLFLIPEGFVFSTNSTYSFSENLIVFGSNIYVFSFHFFSFLFSMDLLHPAHLGFFLLLILLGLGIRPSYIEKKSFKKIDMFYDLRNIKDHLLHHPIYVIIFFLIAYCFAYVSVLFDGNWYVSVFSLFGWFSVIAIAALVIALGLLLLVRISDELPDMIHWVPLLTLMLSYILLRSLFYVIPVPYLTSISLLGMLAITSSVTVLLFYLFTNKFKTKEKMKTKKTRQERMDDGPRRLVKP
ncbi:MAG: hypothetical protein QCH96_05205 [Candidatus Thermoplasmatota archaeon]|nr:hypothetical protein [Candidatus Thermoplasmatota archaeon]